MEITPSTSQPKKVIPKSSGGMDSELSKLGNSLITQFHVLMRITQIYDSKNVALNQFVTEFLDTINTLINREGVLSLKIVKNDFFLNDQPLRYSVEGFTSFKYLLTQWKKRLIGEIIFKEPLDERVLKEFIYALMSLEENQEENATLFIEKLVNRDIHSIEVNPLEVSEEEGEEGSLRKENSEEIAKKVFFETI